MRYLLDTNTCIRFLNGRAPAVRQRLAAVRRDDIAVCSPVKAELFYGAVRSHDPVGCGNSICGPLKPMNRPVSPSRSV